MTIVHLITGLGHGGSEHMLAKLLTHMDRTRFKNVVISMTSQGPLGERIAASGIPVIPLAMQGPWSAARGLLRLIRALRRVRPDVLQTWLYHADLLGLIAGRLSGIPAVAWNIRCSTLRREDHPAHLWWTVKVLARLARFPRAVVANSRSGIAASERLGYRPRRWAFIPNGFDVETFRPSGEARSEVRDELGLPRHTLLIGLVARLDPMKDHATFLAAAGRLRQMRPDVHFMLVGADVVGTNPMLRSAIVEQRLEGVVHLCGERVDIPRVTAALDIATCSSYSEGFPNVIGEAMACGIPCVVTDVGDCAEVVGDTGVVVPSRNAEALAAAWCSLCDLDCAARASLGERARERILRHYSAAAVARRYEQLYEQCIAA